MSNVDFVKDVKNFVEKVRDAAAPNAWYFFTGGSGFPDEVCIKYFEKSNIIVVTRDGRQYCKGKLLDKNYFDESKGD